MTWLLVPRYSLILDNRKNICIKNLSTAEKYSFFIACKNSHYVYKKLMR